MHTHQYVLRGVVDSTQSREDRSINVQAERSRVF
ncbi:uncharacterized protein METZ01_LOCUS376892 [marine metagenome]|uniref:Uncharacterized protein n=1 Tax=marine metagenome TaxID=408172 RepID=A0A382TRE9_9ZZZZ